MIHLKSSDRFVLKLYWSLVISSWMQSGFMFECWFAESWEIEWKRHTRHRQKYRSRFAKNANFLFLLHSWFANKSVFFRLFVSRSPASLPLCVPKHWFMFQHDSSLFCWNWNSFLFQRQRLMQVNGIGLWFVCMCAVNAETESRLLMN